MSEIGASHDLQIIEVPDYKRRWRITPKDMSGRVLEFEDEVRAASLQAVADTVEAVLRTLSGAAVVSMRVVSAACEKDTTFAKTAASTLFGAVGSNVAVEQALSENAVPFLAALRYTDTGLEKRAAWESTWALQRREDAGEAVEIPVAPKYDSKDYRDATTWRLRGKLDVPKERFISYPGAEKDDDPSPIFGWAGWDHLDEARALTTLYVERKDADGWGASDDGRARLVPLLAGLLELLPWLLQWHDAPHPDFGGEGPGSWYARYIEGEARAIGRTLDVLRGWRPAKGRRQR